MRISTNCFISSAPSFPALLANSSFLRQPLHQHTPKPRAPVNNRTPRMSLPLPSDLPSPFLPYLPLSDISEVNKGPLLATSFVFFLTFWGGISFVKGSTKPRITQASFTLRQSAPSLAKQTARYLMERSFVADLNKDGRNGVITFTGTVRASTSVALILVAVAASGIWSASYILNFVLPESLQSPNWAWLTLLSFAIVPWYWKQATRTEEVKLMLEEEGDLSKLYVKGHRDEIEALEAAFKWKRDEPVYETAEAEKTEVSA